MIGSPSIRLPACGGGFARSLCRRHQGGSPLLRGAVPALGGALCYHQRMSQPHRTSIRVSTSHPQVYRPCRSSLYYKRTVQVTPDLFEPEMRGAVRDEVFATMGPLPAPQVPTAHGSRTIRRFAGRQIARKHILQGYHSAAASFARACSRRAQAARQTKSSAQAIHRRTPACEPLRSSESS